MKTAQRLRTLMNQHDASIWPVQRQRLRGVITQTACLLWDEVDQLEDLMSAKRDWLDANRNDPRHAQRKKRFEEHEVKAHMELLMLLERALTIICLDDKLSIADPSTRDAMAAIAEAA